MCISGLVELARGVRSKRSEGTAGGNVGRLGARNKSLRNVGESLSKTLTREKCKFVQDHLAVGVSSSSRSFGSEENVSHDHLEGRRLARDGDNSQVLL